MGVVADPDFTETDSRLDLVFAITTRLDAMRASLSAIYAIDAIKAPTAREARNAAWAALEAVASFEDYKGGGEAAEEQWQEQALKLVESWGNQPITRDMFAVLGDDPPVWFPWPKRRNA